MMKKVLSSGYTIRTFIDIANHDRGTWRVSYKKKKYLSQKFYSTVYNQQHLPYLSLIKVYYPIFSPSLSSIQIINVAIAHIQLHTPARTHTHVRAYVYSNAHASISVCCNNICCWDWKASFVPNLPNVKYWKKKKDKRRTGRKKRGKCLCREYRNSDG